MHFTRSEQALVHLLRNDIITTEPLNALWGRDYGAETLRDMERRGWAVEIKLAFKVGAKARAYKRTCFAITQKGIDYLANKCDLSNLVEDYDPAQEYAARKTASPAASVARLLKEITVNIFFAEFGAITLPIAAAGRRTPQAASGNQADAAWDADIDDSFFDLESDYVPRPKPTNNRQLVPKKPYIPDLIRMKQKKEIAAWSKDTIPENTFYFCARSVMRKSGDYPQEYRELSMSECAGVLATDKKAVLVYTASTDGMPWNAHSATADSKIARAFCFNHHIQNSTGNKARGILLASAPSVLTSLLFNRSKRKMRARFGTGLTALHMIPLSKDGMTFLRHIMEDDLVNYRRALCQQMCDSGAYTANSEFHSKSEYPVIETATGVPCAYGIDMDYNLIAGWYDILSGNTDRQDTPALKIICFKFQLPYYQAIFADLRVEYILAPPPITTSAHAPRPIQTENQSKRGGHSPTTQLKRERLTCGVGKNIIEVENKKGRDNSMTRKIAVMLMALLAAFSLLACGAKEPNGPNTGEAGNAVQELFVTTIDGKQVVVDAAGNASDGYMLDTDGNIVDVSTKKVVVKSAEVKTYETPSDKDADDTTGPPESDVKRPTSETGNNNGSENSSTGGTSGSSSSGPSGNENSGGSKPSGGNNSASGGSSSSGGSSGTGTSDPPAPVHTHSWQKVYRTEIVDDYETRYVSYCVCCGQDMTDWTNEQVNDHAENHVLNGESGQWRTEGKPFKIGSHEERILDHYACSCGATKPI